VKGDATKEEVFSEIEKLLSSSLDKKTEIVASAWAGNIYAGQACLCMLPCMLRKLLHLDVVET